MSIFYSLILGIVQGVTEFLPISSTAHLILIPWLFNWTFNPDQAFAFDVLVQLGTLVAVVVYFARDLWQIALALLGGLRRGQPFDSENARLGWLVIVATIPAGLIGLFFKKFFVELHNNPVMVAGILLGAAGLLFIVERLGRHNRTLDSLTWLDAILIGCSQALALLPGVSRSASTMSGAILLGLERRAVARFSFLMSIPIMIAASGLALKDLIDLPDTKGQLPSLAVGFIAAAVVGIISIHWLMRYLARHSLYLFAWYRIGFGALCLIVAFLR